MLKISHTAFVTSAPSIRQAPPANVLPEVVVVGRSNVGKSSFLCSITGHKGLAKVSSVPGKTRLINYFCVDEKWYLVDLPGYGFAKVSKKEQERWSKSLEEYLEQREGIVLAILLVDSRHEPKDNDLQMYHWLAQRGFPIRLVLTKCDKCSRMAVQKMRNTHASVFGVPVEETLTYSALTGDGKEAMLDVLGQAIGH